MQNKSIIFTDDYINDIYCLKEDSIKIGLIYQNIVQKLYDDGYKTFFIEIKKGLNDIILESILKVKDKFKDIQLMKILKCLDDEKENVKDDIVIIKEPFCKNDYILAQCDKMIFTAEEKVGEKSLNEYISSRYNQMSIIPISYNVDEANLGESALIKSVEINSAAALFIYESDLTL